MKSRVQSVSIHQEPASGIREPATQYADHDYRVERHMAPYLLDAQCQGTGTDVKRGDPDPEDNPPESGPSTSTAGSGSGIPQTGTED